MKALSIVVAIMLAACSTPQKEADPPKVMELGAIPFDPNKPFSIHHLKKSNDHLSSSPDKTICEDWYLAEKEIVEIIQSARPIPGEEWHYAFSVLRCEFLADIKQNGQTYALMVNAGAWLTIDRRDTSLIYGIYEASLHPYFLDSAWVTN